ncbi:hypothetical protein TNCV_1794591 [Trichonephila clavipes]|nr:hypothetical protein TNCV_1794591 [Trichonephila clavipes]
MDPVAAIAESSRYQIVSGHVMSLSPVPLRTRRVKKRVPSSKAVVQLNSAMLIFTKSFTHAEIGLDTVMTWSTACFAEHCNKI